MSHLSAADWSWGMVTGNGRQGAVGHGDPTALRVTLSHEGLFLPVHEPLPAPGTARILPELRALCYAGRFADAAGAVVALAVDEDPRYLGLREADPFIGAATVTFTPTPTPAGPARGWCRTVDHATGVVTHAWHDDAGPRRHELFVSRADDVVVMRWTGRFDGTVHLAPIDGVAPAPILFTTEPLGLRATFPEAWPGGVTGYRVRARLTVEGGRTVYAPDAVVLDGAHGLTLVARTTLGGEEPLPAEDYDELLARHAPRHRDLFERCRLRLGTRDADLPTERLLAEASPALVERLFDAGRYAVICSSGELPPNLQGVWSGTYEPAWRGGYTVDGNLAAALAAVCATGTPELLLPLFDLVERHLDDFRDNARRLYGVPGILLPPHLSTHGRHNHFNDRWCLTFWTAGAAWIARLYHEYWRYTGDEEFLRRRAWPFLSEAAAFYRAFLVDGSTFVPSYSPENSPEGSPSGVDDGSQACIDATMDAAAVRGLFRDLGDGAAAARLPGYRVAPDGALAEWLWPRPHGNHAHRHASHLYGLWYEPDPELLDEPELRAAATASVGLRLKWWREQADGEMAFGLAQVGLAAAALGLAEEAYEVVTTLATRYWRPNLVSTHNDGALFNTDICGAFPALVVAMLVRARGERIDLLPALPAAWPSGAITGVRLRGGLRVEELRWTPERVEVALTGPDRSVAVGPHRVFLHGGRTARLTLDRLEA